MRIRIERGAGIGADWSVTAPAGTTVRELLVASGLDAAGGAAVDDRWYEAGTPLDDTGWGDGSVVGPGASPEREPAAASLALVGGPDAGRRIALTAGPITLGRAPSNGIAIRDPTISRRHARLQVNATGTVDIADLDSRNGTSDAASGLAAGALVRFGSTAARIEAAQADDTGAPPIDLSRIAFHRPPRRAHAPVAAPLQAPVTPEQPAPPKLAAATIVVPLVTGAVLALAYGPQLAVLALIGPVVALGGWLAARHASTRAARDAHRAHASAMATFAIRARAAYASEAHARRARQPDLVAIIDRARGHAPTLWQRRPYDDDFLRLCIGSGDVTWRPATTTQPDPAAAAVLDKLSELRDVPITIDARSLVGIVGDRVAARALARALVVAAAVHHGPADLRIAVITSAVAEAEWDWARWLPHTIDPDDTGATLVRHRLDDACELAARDEQRLVHEDCAKAWWVVDGDDESLARTGSVRAVLTSRERAVGGIVITESVDRLPATCRTVIDVSPAGQAQATDLEAGGSPIRATIGGLSVNTARRAALRLARLDDVDAVARAARLPDHASLVTLLTTGPIDAAGIESRWAATHGTDALVAPIGSDAGGSFNIDLVHDGPHALVAGTTGSGKSELLRSLVASLAATADVEHCNFVLVDYKGGAAFDRLAALPHVVGVVTDLDDRLAARALRCLDAELRRRESLLRGAGASDVTAYVRRRRERHDLVPLPRLLVVIDEFATLAAELPEFIDSLVDVAQRGRSLGVHLILATQRPAGAVNDSIRTNTNLRICLRVVDTADSRDVLGCDDAARLPRHRPGRAVARIGQGEVLTFQAAHISGVTSADEERLALAPWDGVPRAAPSHGRERMEEPTDLDCLVDAITAAHVASLLPLPHRPWPDALPLDLTLDDLVFTNRAALDAFGLVDLPDAQRTGTLRWDLPSGNLLIAGLAGSGVTTGLTSIALSLARASTPASLHLYLVSSDHASVAPLVRLPHCGAVIAADDRERVVRLVKQLDTECRRRRQGGHNDAPRIVTIIDGAGALRAELDDPYVAEHLDMLERVAADGAAVGLHFAFGADHPATVGHRLDRTIACRVLLRLPDRSDYLTAGLRGVEPAALPPGRGYLVTGEEVQLARPARDTLGAAVDALRTTATLRCAAVPSVGRLPEHVEASAVVGAARLDAHRLWLPLGIGDASLEPTGVVLRDGDHLVVAGPGRAGKTTALATMSEVLRALPGMRVETIGSRRYRRSAPTPVALASLVESLLDQPAPAVVLVDDADLLDDAGALTALIQPGRPRLHVVAAGRGDRLRGLFRHWTAEVRRARIGLLLRGDETDGDLLNVRLPRRPVAPWTAGRGWLVQDDRVELCQVAAPVAGETDEDEVDRCA